MYEEITGQGNDVVLMHGWGCDHRHMRPIADFLSSRYRVTNIDLPGRGQSVWQEQINSLNDMADALLPYLPKEAIYIGWSFGGLVATSIASRYPERVKRIIGIGSTPKFIEDENWPGVPQPGFKASFNEVKAHGFKAFFEGWYDAEFADFNPKPASYNQLLKLLEASNKENLDVLLKGIEICDATDLRKEFSSIKCPIDLILGGQDTSVPMACHQAIKKINSHVKIHLIQDAQHMMFWTHPEAFQKILQEIL